MKEKRFEKKYQQHMDGGIVRIIVDRETSVNYIITSGMGTSGMTPLLDREGKVVVDK